MFVRPDRAGETFRFDSDIDIVKEKKIIGEGLWGGDKTWIAPQDQWIEKLPPLVIDAGPYQAQLIENGIEMKSAHCSETGLAVTRMIKLDDAGRVHLSETITNVRDHLIRRGIWNVTQFLRPFDVWIPADDVSAYAAEGDSIRLKDRVIAKMDGWTRIRCAEDARFKYGARVKKGIIAALRRSAHEVLVYMRAFKPAPDADYAHDVQAEVYNSKEFDYLEIELHAPLKTLLPGDSQSQEQTWTLIQKSAGVSDADILNDLTTSQIGE